MSRLRILVAAAVFVGPMFLAMASNAAETAESELAPSGAAVPAVGDLVDDYVERYLTTFPSRATAAGDHRFDRELENPSAVRVEDWIEFNEQTESMLAPLVGASAAAAGTGWVKHLDARAVLRHARREIFRHRVLDVRRKNPLYWTGIVGGMTAHLLVRDDLALKQRLRALAVRVGEVPRLCHQARSALSATPPEEFARIHVETAARQAASSARFFESGLAEAAAGLSAEDQELVGRRLGKVGQAAAVSLRELADFLEQLAPVAVGSARLGDLYAESFRLGTGVEQPVAEVLAEAERRLVEERSRTADYCRSIWRSAGIDRSSGLAKAPVSAASGDGAADRADVEVVRACFSRIALDHADDLDDFVADFRRLASEAEDFATEREIVELPAGFSLFVDTSPAYFVGQSVGGVYPPGPFAPDGAVLLFVPSYSPDTPSDAVAAFHRDFNDHFNAMITPHETVPGHGAQIALAAHRAARTGEVARELFADGVYVEGWGTFSELLMLDAGWGGPLDRVAHLKKRLENIARLIVDLRVHTTDTTEDEILRFVRDEALQDEQFAANMWRRALLTSPQLASYDLGSRRIYDLYQRQRAQLGQDFDAGAFVRAMIGLGSVSLDAYEALFEGDRLLDSRTVPREASEARPSGFPPVSRPESSRGTPQPGSSSHGL